MVKKIYTAKEIAQYCDVAPRTVSQWIREGKIKAYQTPGNHNRIKKEDFVCFLNQYHIPIPDDLNENDTKKRILIVDDDEAMVNSIQRMLVREKIYDIEVAYDGFIAGQKFITHKPDLVILDLRMPKVDGYKLCSAIRGDAKNKSVKILIISGVVEIEGKEKIMKLGANDYVSKPFDNNDLKKKIEKLLKINR